VSTYDLLGRLKTQVTPVEVGDSTVTYTRNGLSTATLDGQSHTTTRNSNPDGTLKEVVNALHKTTAYAYNPFGELTGIQDSGGNSTAMTYDARGFQRTLDDPDSSGLWVTEYTAFGEVWRTRDPKTASSAWTMVMTYDQLGRQTKRQEAEGDTTWVYYPTNVGTDRRKGLLNHVTGPLAGSSTAFQQTYLYNGQAQVRQTLSTIAGKNFQTDMTYNQGQLSTMIYPLSVSGNRHSFSWQYRNGITSRLDATDGGINTTIWTLAASDPLGRAQHVKFGPGTMITDEQRGLDPRSLRLTGIQTGQALGTGIQNYGYTWDKAGNLTKRQNLAAGGKTEVFAYDVLNRLDTVTLNTTQTLNVDYDDGVGGTPGNIQYKSDYGTYTYGQWGAGPRAVTSVSGPESMTYHYDVNGNMDCRGWNATALSCTPAATADEIQWTSFNLPKRIERQSAYSTLDYGPDRQVIRQIRAAPGLGFRNITTVGPHFEYEVSGASVTRWRHTAYVDGQAVYLQVDEEIPGGHAGSEINYYAYYVHHDHQGSWDELTPAWGSAGKVSYSFDAFGKRREPDWTADVDNSQQFGTEHMSRKGYTGHEHLDHLGMIHMRGRVQEPILGRMISRDPLLGDIGNPETLNRYAYVVNNPATLTDPTGFGPCYFDCTVVFEGGYWTYGEYINHSTGERFPLPPSWTPARGNIDFGGSSGTFDVQDVQNVLSAAGFAGPVGPFADAVNATISAARGNWDDAAINAIAIIPVIGDTAKGVKITVDGAKAAKSGSKIDRGAFKKDREAYWKKEAESNPGKYAKDDLDRMRSGRAPTGPDGKPIELHHRDGTPNGPLDPMSRTDHRGGDNYKKNHPWLGD